MFPQRYSSQDTNHLANINYQDNDLEFRSPQYQRKKISLSQIEGKRIKTNHPLSILNSYIKKGDRIKNGDPYQSPFKMMANQNILLKQSSSYKDVNKPSSFKTDNIFQYPVRNSKIDLKFMEGRDFQDGIIGQLSHRDNLQTQNQKDDIMIRNNNEMNNQMSPQIKQGNKLDQSILEYQKYFPLLNYSNDQQGHNSSLLNYLTNQETELIQSLGKLQNNPQQKQLKIKHLEVVSQLIQLLKQQQDNQIKSDIQVIENGHVESVSYSQSDGFFVKWHQVEKIPHDVESIQIEYGIFRKGDLLKTYRQTDKLATISLNWKFNKCIINHSENFRNIYPTQNTFIYFDVKVFGQNVKEPKNWSWTLHTLFTEEKKLLQGCFKLPLYSKNHIPHALFQTGFPFLSECFIYIEVFLKQDYQLGNQLNYDQYVIPKLHLKEKQLDSIEEDVVVNQFVNEHIKQNGMIKSTFKDEELQMREYNARQKLKLVKKEEIMQMTGSAWMQQGTQKIIQDKANQKSYINQEPDILDSKDIFDQISQMKDKKRIPPQIPTPTIQIPQIPQEQIQVIPKQPEEVEDNLSKEEQADTFVYTQTRQKIRTNTLQGLSQTSIKLLKKREAKQQQEQDQSTSQQKSKGSISQTMQKILEKRNQANLQQKLEYSQISSINKNNSGQKE